MTETFRGPAPTLAVVAVLLAVPVLVYAGYLAYDTTTYVPGPGEDTSLYGLGYLFAVVLALPAGLGLLLATASFLVRGRRPSLASGLGTAGVIAAGLPVLLVTEALVGW